MPNRTISLDDVSDAIRKEIIKTGMPFSRFVKLSLRAWRPVESEPKVDVRPRPNKHYLCRYCKQSGHWSDECPHIEVVE